MSNNVSGSIHNINRCISDIICSMRDPVTNITEEAFSLNLSELGSSSNTKNCFFKVVPDVLGFSLGYNLRVESYSISSRNNCECEREIFDVHHF